MRKLILTSFIECEDVWTLFGFRHVYSGYSGYDVDYDVAYEYTINNYRGNLKLARKGASDNYESSHFYSYVV